MKFRTKRVVTAFLEHRGRILLLHRSRRIRTYPGYWAGVSGTVDSQEDIQVYVEILEETGLTAAGLTLVQKGRPMSTRDRSLGVRWVITPYLFKAHTSRIRLNSENIEYRWVRPRELASFQTPPRFVDGFGRVYPPFAGLPRPLARRIRRSVLRVARDRSHGAAELARIAGALIRSIPSNRSAWRRTAASTLAAARPLMPGIRVEGRAQDRCRHLPHPLQSAPSALTHSYSSTVLAALRILRPQEIFATDSFPLGEGRRTQALLREEGFTVHRVPDGDVEKALGHVDAVLIGADAVLPGRGIVNKVGTEAILRRAFRRGIPTYAVCDRGKRMRGIRASLDLSLVLRALDPEGYFEFCPIRLLSRICYV